MYVCELDRTWLGTPFMFQGFTIRDAEELKQLRELCKFVFVDTERSDDDVLEHITAASRKAAGQQDNGTEAWVRPYVTPIEDELKTARKLHERTQVVLDDLFSNARGGRALQTEPVKKMVTHMVDSIMRNPDAMVLLGQLHDHDEYAVAHSINVCTLALNFARYLGYDKERMHELGLAAILHDIGEVSIPLDILHKNGLLSSEERRLVESHTTYGAELLAKSGDLPRSVIEVALKHHERYNGKGYPAGLQDEKIDTMSKIVGIVDVYDSVTTSRSYRPGISSTDALKNMYNWRNELFDGTLVEQFIQCLGIYPIGSVVELNTAEVGIIISASPGRRLLPKLMLVRNAKKKPYLPPKILDLSQHANSGTRYDIIKVLEPTAYGIDLKNYLLREMHLDKLTSVPV